MIDNRPCGACGELVPAASGCGHWHPGQGHAGRAKGKGAASAARKKERDREYHRAARLRAKENAQRAVDEFRRVMTGEA